MPPPVRVNVGAGSVRLDRWINTDVVWWSDMYLT
jgi:predicted SAM-dependent methyltransferase